jgi:hypothetical protein
MGRPLKIKKTTTKDIGFNSFDQLENPVYPATLNTTQFLGVVGGANAIGGSSVATSTNPVVRVQVYIAEDSEERAGFIITQKGATKYLVAANVAVADEDLVVGNSYIIATVVHQNPHLVPVIYLQPLLLDQAPGLHSWLEYAHWPTRPQHH